MVTLRIEPMGFAVSVPASDGAEPWIGSNSGALEPKLADGITPIDPAKAADIQRLIEVAGTRQLLVDTMATMQANVRPTLIKALPPGPYREKLINLFFERLQTKMSIQQFLDMAAAAYDKYLTDDDVKALIAFYQTPLGQKTLTVLPKMAAELQVQGMRIGEEAGRESMQEVLAEHPELARSMQDAAALRQ